MIVYKITNLLTGKSYIGQTVGSMRRRWNRHCSESSCVLLNRSIKKYGKENFEIKVLAYCNNIEEMNHREQYCIKLFKTLAPNGYNVRSGGNEQIRSKFVPVKHTEESKMKIRIARKKQIITLESKIRRSFSAINKKTIICNETGQEFASISDTAKFFNTDRESISRIIRGKRKTFKNMTFSVKESAL